MMSISQFNVEQPAAAFVLFQAYHLRSVASCCDCSLVNFEQGPIFGYQVRADCLDNEHDKNLYDGQLWRNYFVSCALSPRVPLHFLNWVSNCIFVIIILAYGIQLWVFFLIVINVKILVQNKEAVPLAKFL